MQIIKSDRVPIYNLLMSLKMCLSVADVRELAINRYAFGSCPGSFCTVNHFSNWTGLH